MKACTIFFTIIFILVIDIKSQSNSFVDCTKVWYISEFPDPCPSCTWLHKIVLGKDTMINSYNYKTVFDYQDSKSNRESKSEILGYIRETSDKRVYWYVGFFDRTPSEVLLYDFNASIGDTIDHWVVTSIDSIYIRKNLRKRLTLKFICGIESKTWIEGIGDMSDILSYLSRPTCDEVSGIVGYTIGSSRFSQTHVKQGDKLIFKSTKK